MAQLQDLSNNVAVQQGLKRALARVAGGVAESAVTLLWACLSALGLDEDGRDRRESEKNGSV